MWWSRVSYCVLSLTLALGAAGCGSSGFQGQSGDDALTMSFQGFTEEGITQEDTVGNTSADVDVCQDICSVGGGLIITDIVYEAFTTTTANAVFVNNGTADILVDEYTVSIITPEMDIPPRTVSADVLLPGGRCTGSPTTQCGFDDQCGALGPCNHAQTSVQVLLYSLVEKSLIVGDQMCPMLDTSTSPFTVIPGDVPPKTYQTNIKFHGSDETGKGFTVYAGVIGAFSDVNNCTGSSGSGSGS